MNDNKGCGCGLGSILVGFIAVLVWRSHSVGEFFAAIGVVIGGLLLLVLGIWMLSRDWEYYAVAVPLGGSIACLVGVGYFMWTGSTLAEAHHFLETSFNGDTIWVCGLGVVFLLVFLAWLAGKASQS